jgi:hypothetical protein
MKDIINELSVMETNGNSLNNVSQNVIHSKSNTDDTKLGKTRSTNILMIYIDVK